MWNIVSLITLLCIASFPKEDYKESRKYNNIELQIESPQRQYPQGAAILLRLRVTNKTNKTLTFVTRGRPISSTAVTSQGTSDPRPVFDIVIRKGAWKHPDGFWLWSQNQKESPPNRIVLRPKETRLLIETTWKPEKPFVQADIFIRFDNAEFPTRIGVEPPRR